MDAMRHRCEYCEALYWIPSGADVAVESTRDIPPPAHCVVWWLAPIEELAAGASRIEGARILHECHHGRPGSISAAPSSAY